MAQELLPETLRPDDDRPSREMDEELKIIGRMLRQLDSVDEAARCRIVSYLSSRYKENP